MFAFGFCVVAVRQTAYVWIASAFAVGVCPSTEAVASCHCLSAVLAGWHALRVVDDGLADETVLGFDQLAQSGAELGPVCE